MKAAFPEYLNSPEWMSAVGMRLASGARVVLPSVISVLLFPESLLLHGKTTTTMSELATYTLKLATA